MRQNPYKNRVASIAVVAFALVLALGACGSSETETTEPADTTTTAAATDTTVAGSDTTVPTVTERSGDLVVGYVTTVNQLSPHPFGANTFPFRDALYDPLIAIDAAGQPVPALAESWSMSDDNLELTLNIRDGVTYHDGTPFDAQAALANIEWFQDPATGVQGAGTWATITAAAPDADTLVLTFSQPTPEIFSLLDIALVSKPGQWDEGIGTGPFVLESFTPRVGLKLKANENYWDPALPKVSTLTLREFSDLAAASLVAEAGDLDVLLGIRPQQVDQLTAVGMTINETPGSGNFDILVNTTDAGIGDSRVRRALSLAFDRQRFADVIMQGYATPWSSIYPPGSPVHLSGTADVTPFDLDAAKALLDEAGVSALEVTIMSPEILPTHQFLPIYQEDLAKIGVTLVIEPTDPATWAQAVATSGSIPPLASHAYGFGDLDPALLFSAHPFRVGSNASGFVSDEYATLVAAAKAETDVEARYAAFGAVDDFIAEEAFMFPIVNVLSLDAISSDVEGFSRSRQTISYEQASISE